MENQRLYQEFERAWGRKTSPENKVFKFLMKLKRKAKKGKIVLDVGAGECRFKAFAGKAKYIALDFCKGDDRWNYSKIDIVGNVMNLPIRDKTVDLVLCTSVLEHVPEPQRLLDEVYRVLKPGGELFLYVPFVIPEHQVPYDYFRYTQFGLKYLFEKSGFKIKSIVPNGTSSQTICSLFYLPLSGLQGPCRHLFRISMKFLIDYVLVPLYNLVEKISNQKNKWSFPSMYLCIVEK